MQAERKAKRSLGFDCIENGLRFGHSRTSSVMALDLRRFCRGAATAPIIAEAQPQPRLSRIPSRTCSRTVEAQGLRRSQSSRQSRNSTILRSRSQCLAFHPILTRRRKCRGKLYSDTPSFLSYGWKMDSDASCLCSPGIRIGGLDSRTEKLFKISCHPEKAGFSGAGFRFLFARRGLFRV